VRIGYMYKMHAYPPKGGNHVHALELVQGFLKRGHEVCVHEDPGMPGATNFSGSSESDLKSFVNSIDVIYIRIDARYLSEWPEVGVCMEMAGERPVVWEINAPANETLAFSWLGGRKLGARESLLKQAKRWFHAALKKPGIRREEQLRRSLASRVDTAICVSSSLRDYACGMLGISDARVLPNGGPLITEEEINKRRAERESDNFTVFYSGSAIYPWQGLDYLARVIELARNRAPDIRFVLAVNQRTEFLPTGQNVEIRQGLDREGILDAICNSDACVALHPDYPWSPYGFHNSPMKLFEYMACRTAIVTSNRGQMREVINHGINGMLVSDEPEDILDKLLELKENSTLRESVAFGAWKTINHGCSWEDNVKFTLDTFRKNSQ